MSKLPKTFLCKDGDLEIPMVSTLYDFFSPRTKTITIWSIGFQHGGLEATIAESTGATIQIFDCSPEAKQRYDVFNRVMANHETQEGDPKWAEDLCNQWILPDSMRFESEIPYSYTGTLMKCDTNVRLIETNVERVDICKIDYGEFTLSFLYDFLNRGYRPGLLWVHWPAHPDESSTTMAAAGHLQNLGYRLLKSTNNYFLYIFVDECLYEICSWNDTTVTNPLVAEYTKQLFQGLTQQKVEEPSK